MASGDIEAVRGDESLEIGVPGGARKAMRAKWMLLAKIQLMGLLGLNRARKTDDARVRRKAVGGAVAFGDRLADPARLHHPVRHRALRARADGGGAGDGDRPGGRDHLLFLPPAGKFDAVFALKDHDAVMSLPVSRSAVIGAGCSSPMSSTCS